MSLSKDRGRFDSPYETAAERRNSKDPANLQFVSSNCVRVAIRNSHSELPGMPLRIACRDKGSCRSPRSAQFPRGLTSSRCEAFRTLPVKQASIAAVMPFGRCLNP